MKTRALLVSLIFSLDGHAYESAGQSFNIEILTEQKDCIWGFDFLPS